MQPLTVCLYFKDLHAFIYLILPAALGPRAYSASNRNEYRSREIIVLWSRVRPVLRADILDAVCEPIV
jgi:hypothetical protein